jgi:hypothetical protein
MSLRTIKRRIAPTVAAMIAGTIPEPRWIPGGTPHQSRPLRPNFAERRCRFSTSYWQRRVVPARPLRVLLPQGAKQMAVRVLASG